MIAYDLNRTQTVIDEELKNSIPEEVWNDFIETYNSIQFLRNLAAPEETRKFAKDLPRWDDPNSEDRELDPKGKIEVNITAPHILQDMDFFRERAIHFTKYGKYTNITPSKHKNSDYFKFWKEELRKWRDGLVRPEDGEWIPGAYYFYLNYCPILINVEDAPRALKKVSLRKSSDKIYKLKRKRGRRIRGFPEVWLGDYLWYHYREQAEALGEHGALLKAREKGFSYKSASEGPRNMHLLAGLPNYYIAIDSTYLTGLDGIFPKAVSMLDFIAKHTPLSKLRLIDRTGEKKLGYKDEYGVEHGKLSSMSCISVKDNPDKARGIRAPYILYEEGGTIDNLEQIWNINLSSVGEGSVTFGLQIAGGCVCAGTNIWTSDGKYIKSEQVTKSDRILGFNLETEVTSLEDVNWIQPPSNKECVELKTQYRDLKCSTDHPILVRTKSQIKTNEIIGIRRDYYKKLDKWYETPKYKKITVYKKQWKLAGELKVGDVILVNEYIDIWGNSFIKDPRLIGMLIGNGSYGSRLHYGRKEIKTPNFSNCDEELNSYIENNYPHTVTLERLTNTGKLYKEISIRGLIPHLKELGIAGQSKSNKTLPINYLDLSKEDSRLLIAGLFDTDGYIKYTDNKSPHVIQITQSSEFLLRQLKVLLEKFGIQSYIFKTNPRISKQRKDKNSWYTLSIGTIKGIQNFYLNIPLIVKYKKEALEYIYLDSLKNNVRVYNKFNNILEERIISVENIGVKPVYNFTVEPNNVYLANNIITHNTGGIKDAKFEGLRKLFYDPVVYNIHGIPNVFDIGSDGSRKVGFFWPEYLNRKGYYDSNGNPDVTGALLEIIKERVFIKYHSKDPHALTQRKAETCITPQEAILRVNTRVFPVGDLKAIQDSLVLSGTFDANHYIGLVEADATGTVRFKPSGAVYPVRQFPLSDSVIDGAIEIFELPVLNGFEKRPATGRYIASMDPYANDAEDTESNSIGSFFILDLLTDRIVAEYSARPVFTDDYFERCILLARMYNARIMYENNIKGLYNYCNKHNKLWMLYDRPEILAERQYVKSSTIGNTSKGYPSTSEIKSWGRTLIREWLLTKATEQDENVDINDEFAVRRNMHTLRSPALLEELIRWNPDGNFDRVSSLIGLMIAREEYRHKFLNNYTSGGSSNGKTDDPKYITNSKFYKGFMDKRKRNISYKEKRIVHKEN